MLHKQGQQEKKKLLKKGSWLWELLSLCSIYSALLEKSIEEVEAGGAVKTQKLRADRYNDVTIN